MARFKFPRGKAGIVYGSALAGTFAVTLAIEVAAIFRDAGEVSPAASGKILSGAPQKKVAKEAKDKPRKADEQKSVSVAEAASHFTVKRILKIDRPFRHGDYVWDDAGVPEGPVVITIDTKAQTLSVFRDGYEIGAAVILYGATDKPSPLGVFPILEKDAGHVSRTYGDAPMPWSLRLTNDWVAIHGSDVEWGYATHGCFGVPPSFARKLFGVANVGDPVIVTDGKMMHLG